MKYSLMADKRQDVIFYKKDVKNAIQKMFRCNIVKNKHVFPVKTLRFPFLYGILSLHEKSEMKANHEKNKVRISWTFRFQRKRQTYNESQGLQ